jgi:uncharacterized protein YkwD
MARVRLIKPASLCAALTVVVLMLGVPGTAGAGGGARSAHGDRAGRATISGRGFATRLLRLQNAERGRRGLPRLSVSRDLDRAARRHARDMVRHHYFGHFSHAGRNVVDRVASTRYGHGRHFAAQENLFWWSTRRSAAAVVAAWMGSAVHRANVLRRGFHQFGIAVVRRSPYGRGGVTVVGVYATHLRG